MENARDICLEILNSINICDSCVELTKQKNHCDHKGKCEYGCQAEKLLSAISNSIKNIKIGGEDD